MLVKENQKYNKRIISNPNSYKQYDNYDAIEVPVTAGIPNDYTVEKIVTQEEYDALIGQGFHVEVLSTTNGGGQLIIRICNPVMGVPISFLDKYCPEQFEIVRFRHGNDEKDLRITVSGKKSITPYFRVLIRHKVAVSM